MAAVVLLMAVATVVVLIAVTTVVVVVAVTTMVAVATVVVVVLILTFYFGFFLQSLGSWLTYAIPVATTDGDKFSFYPCSISLWNQLPSTAVFAASLAAFQAIALTAVIGMKLPIGSKML